MPTPRSKERAAPRGPARRAPATSGRPWPSPLNTALRSSTLGVLPRDCVHPLRACTKPCPAGARRVRWSRTPRTPAAPHSECSPHPRIAREVRAPHSVRRARSRGSRRPCDITRNYAAHLLCVQARHAPSVAHESPRPRNPSLCHMAASASLRSQRLPRIPARHRCASCTRCAARIASARHPWLARFVSRAAVARGLLCAAPARLQPRAQRLAGRCASSRGRSTAFERTADRQRDASEASQAKARIPTTSKACSLLSSQRSAVLGLSMPSRLRRSLREH